MSPEAATREIARQDFALGLAGRPRRVCLVLRSVVASLAEKISLILTVSPTVSKALPPTVSAIVPVPLPLSRENMTVWISRQKPRALFCGNSSLHEWCWKSKPLFLSGPLFPKLGSWFPSHLMLGEQPIISTLDLGTKTMLKFCVF